MSNELDGDLLESGWSGKPTGHFLPLDQNQLFCMDYALQFERRFAKQTCFLGPTMYAALARAFHLWDRRPNAVPNQMWLRVPSVKAESIFEAGEVAHIRLIVVRSNADLARAAFHETHLALNELGRLRDAGHTQFLAGNFVVGVPTDPIACATWEPDCLPIPLTRELIRSTAERAGGWDSVVVRLESPLRLKRNGGEVGHQFMDADFFCFETLLRATLRRCRSYIPDLIPPYTFSHCPPARESRLEWHDVGYGHACRRKVFGGVTGAMVFGRLSLEQLETLVIGTYFGCGQLTRMGFGQMSISEGVE